MWSYTPEKSEDSDQSAPGDRPSPPTCSRAPQRPAAAVVLALFLCCLGPGFAATALTPGGASDASSSASAGTADQPDAVDLAVAELLTDWNVPGVLLVVIDGGELVETRAWGVEDLESGRPIGLDTRFRLASISKPVTAAAVLRLVERGDLDLDTDVREYLGALPDLGFLDGPGDLTLAHLLTHTGGFEDRFLTRMRRDPGALEPLATYLRRDMPRRIAPAGTVEAYSNHGIALAGLVVEQALGVRFADAMRELVFEPLDMAKSTFDLPEDLAQGHRFGTAVAPVGIQTIPASMLVSTGNDMVRFLTALIRPEAATFLEPATVERMLSRQVGHLAFVGRTFGWAEDASVEPRRLLHSGNLDGFAAGVVLVPERSGAVLVACNGNAWVWGVIRAVLEQRFPSQPRPFVAPTTDEPASAPSAPRDFAGAYLPAELPRSTFDAVRALFEQQRLEVTGGGARWQGTPYVALGDGLLRSQDGRWLLLRPAQPGLAALLTDAGGTHRRLHWSRDRRLQLGAVLLLLAGLVSLAAGRPRSWKRGTGWPGRLLRAAAGLSLLFVVGLGTVVSVSMANDGGALRFAVPWYVALLFTLPLLSLGCVAVTLAGVLRGACERRAPVLLGAALLSLFSLYLASWNLLGFSW
ncbi:MAG: class A beta-lactamase-related serine hydrolase [Acidobacteria bacterium]|nr:MAG: class A beta-lactamase-related serine hydrolase [Acidobacteriota bacterium]REK00581.1 MAG: class A beta-lactamase-related serine hydrolase [Acidobacteriota bacterium]